MGDLLGQRYSDTASLALMRHAATLDLEQFESSDQQDRLDRARRQVTGRSSILQLVFGQAQDAVTVVALAIGFAAYAPWLLILLALALVPAALGELHFNREGYRLAFGRTPERRQVDYLRYLGASVETAKEIKLFALENFLSDRFASLSDLMYGETRRLAARRALWGGLFATISALSYYAGYAVILWRTLDGSITIGDLGLPRRIPPAAPFTAGRSAARLLATLLPGRLPRRPVFLSSTSCPRSARPTNRWLFPPRSAWASASRTWAFATTTPNDGPFAISTSRSAPERWWRWSARTAPARRRS